MQLCKNCLGLNCLVPYGSILYVYSTLQAAMEVSLLEDVNAEKD